MKKRRPLNLPVLKGRRLFLLMFLLALLGILLIRAIWIEVFQQEELQRKADARQTKDVIVPAYRGMILDRNNEPLAVSSPVVSIAVNPKELLKVREEWRHEDAVNAQTPAPKPPENTLETTTSVTPDTISTTLQSPTSVSRFIQLETVLRRIEQELELADGELLQRLEGAGNKSFFYLGRQLTPETADALLASNLPKTVKIEVEQGYRRFYPLGETAGHVLGLTNLEGNGIEGIEQTQNTLLAGKNGKKRAVRDGKGRLVENVESLEDMQPGQDVRITLDRRIQYLAYRELKNRIVELNAKSGSLVVLDAHTGEILAMANYPSFNPNNRKDLEPNLYRNRAVTDKAEPGSTIKPLTLAAALESRAIGPDVEINTSPGKLHFGKYIVKDKKDYGTISLPTLLAKSSNVGASRVALLMNPRDHWFFLTKVGFGRVPDAGLSGETPGKLTNYTEWSKVDRASHGYGYGLSVSLLQLAHAYAPFAANGVLLPVTVNVREKPVQGQQVMTPENARAVLRMMEAVVRAGGTGEKAMVEGYRIAGKTGTAYKFINNAYRDDRYLTSFIGIAPASRPRLVVAVQIDEPKIEDSGGLAAAPVFSKVMAEALRLLDIPPDNLPKMKSTTQAANTAGTP
ncbi:MAG: peptidoglycan D,D-transpeptidase FtsI family protein [Thiotrichaceae bacterium]|uniref:Penicillin-binding protein 2 n=1 Tax=Candidatus Thiocaldithrix dubininis TaxID=3080823 RepID=A0AA95KFS1_9GAMM|nr:MAG: penicillin-binding protein 2 [Candidatus Thiocaldithrix dubininis]